MRDIRNTTPPPVNDFISAGTPEKGIDLKASIQSQCRTSFVAAFHGLEVGLASSHALNEAYQRVYTVLVR